MNGSLMSKVRRKKKATSSIADKKHIVNGNDLHDKVVEVKKVVSNRSKADIALVLQSCEEMDNVVDAAIAKLISPDKGQSCLKEWHVMTTRTKGKQVKKVLETLPIKKETNAEEIAQDSIQEESDNHERKPATSPDNDERKVEQSHSTSPVNTQPPLKLNDAEIKDAEPAKKRKQRKGSGRFRKPSINSSKDNQQKLAVTPLENELSLESTCAAQDETTSNTSNTSNNGSIESLPSHASCCTPPPHLSDIPTAELSLRKLIQELHRCDISLNKHQQVLKECDLAARNIERIFTTLRIGINARQEDLLQELQNIKETAENILQRRKATALSLRKITESANQLNDQQMAELKKQLKYFTDEKRIDEAVATMNKFYGDPDEILPSVMQFGKILSNEEGYSTWNEEPHKSIDSYVNHMYNQAPALNYNRLQLVHYSAACNNIIIPPAIMRLPPLVNLPPPPIMSICSLPQISSLQAYGSFVHQRMYNPNEILVMQERVRESLYRQGVCLYNPFTGKIIRPFANGGEKKKYTNKKTPTQLRRERKRRQKAREKREKLRKEKEEEMAAATPSTETVGQEVDNEAPLNEIDIPQSKEEINSTSLPLNNEINEDLSPIIEAIVPQSEEDTETSPSKVD